MAHLVFRMLLHCNTESAGYQDLNLGPDQALGQGLGFKVSLNPTP